MSQDRLTHSTEDSRIEAILNPGMTPEESLTRVKLMRQVAVDGYNLILARRREKAAKARGERLRLRILAGLHELGWRGLKFRAIRRFHVQINLRGMKRFPIKKGILPFLGKLVTQVDARIVIRLTGPVSQEKADQIVEAVERILGKEEAAGVCVEFNQERLKELRRVDQKIGNPDPFSVMIPEATEEVEAKIDPAD
jgi:hypothetical protein